MKRKKQINESKDLIAEAFLELLKKDDFDKITLSEIADNAGVTRMTLYRHFKSKEKIILYRAQKFLNAAQIKNYKEEEHSLEQTLFNRFSGIKKLPYIKLLFNTPQLTEILSDIRMRTNREIHEFYSSDMDLPRDPYLSHFFMGGVSEMIKEWIGNDFDESAQEMVRKVMAMLKAMRNLG